MNTIEEMYEQLGISKKVYEFSLGITKELEERFL